MRSRNRAPGRSEVKAQWQGTVAVEKQKGACFLRLIPPIKPPQPLFLTAQGTVIKAINGTWFPVPFG